MNGLVYVSLYYIKRAVDKTEDGGATRLYFNC